MERDADRAADASGAATERLAADTEGIARAAALLKAGELVAFPTETVYGLGADATSGEAVAKIFAAKDRPKFNPLIVHVASVARAEALIELTPQGRALGRQLWPGPLTLVGTLRPGKGIADLTRAGLPTLGVRVPDDAVAQALLRAVQRPLAAPSANPSGQVSPTTADHVLETMGGRIAAVLDGGPCKVGLESTIIGFEHGKPVLLRPGGVTIEQIVEIIGKAPGQPAETTVRAPGQLTSHYAPRSEVVLDVAMPDPAGPSIGFGAVAGAVNLSPGGDLIEAAARLFSALREVDAMAGGRQIEVAPIPNEGLGVAINDRLARAAAPRE